MIFFNLKKRDTKRPRDTCFHQQTPSAIRFKVQPANLLIFSFIWFLITLIITILLFQYNSKLFTITLDYTDCTSIDQPHRKCSTLISENKQSWCSCNLSFSIPHDIKLPLYVAYGIKGFYQNNRRYFYSVDPLQLNGNLPLKDISSNCGEWTYRNNTPILPCGAMAYSLFNDTFFLQKINKDTYENVDLRYIDLLDYQKMTFKNPALKQGQSLQRAFDRFLRPVSWSKNLSELDSSSLEVNGLINPDFVNWMTVAPFKSFIKPYREIVSQSLFLSGGAYNFHINYSFPVSEAKIRKILLISSSSYSGAKNNFVTYSCLASTLMTLLIVILGIIQVLVK